VSRQVLTVGPAGSDGFRTIGEALARARSGAVISVRPGTYEESLVTLVTITRIQSGQKAPVIRDLRGQG
jgi:pectin methylesterase-like acyl-CoA thioesterase